jgi:dihydrofolate reductase
MRKLIVNEWMTLDGVAQAPSSPDEDRDGGFAHGGWHTPHMQDALFQQRTVETIAGAGGYLFGRRTYEAFAAYWPNAPQEEQIIAAPFTSRPKYVIARPGTVLPEWRNTALLSGDPAAAVAALKREAGEYLLVLGSTQLVALLLAHDLVDEFRLMIDPVVVGSGKRLFRDDGVLRALRLVSSEVTSTGAILATYAPAPR